MRPIFEIYLANASAQEGRCTDLTLPATPYQMLDALERIRLTPEDRMYFDVEEYRDFEYLAPYLSETASVYQLNALADVLSKLDRHQSAAFEGLLMMEVGKKDGPITMSRLYDLAHSADCCHVVPEALNDSQLGRFYAEGGFLSEVEQVPEEVFALLDFEALGRKARLAEDGVFTAKGYVVRQDELVQAPPLPEEPPQKPAYTVRLTLTVHPDAVQEEEPPTVTLDLPAAEKELRRVQETLGTENWQGAMIADVDSPLSGYTDLFSSVEDIPTMNRLAQELDRLEDVGQLTKYKALLSALDHPDLEEYIQAAEHLGEYILDGKIGTPEELAENEIDFLVSGDAAELLKKHVVSSAYGKALLERDHAVITPYGFLQREDFQPIQTLTRQSQEMEMKMK